MSFGVTLGARRSSLWKVNVCLLRDNFCLNFKTQPLQVYFPCDEHSCASLEEVSRELYNHNCCTDIISVLDSCVSSVKLLRELGSHTRCTNIIPVESSCDSAKEPLCKFFKHNDYSDIFPVRQSCDSAKSPFCEILKCNPHTQKAVCKSQ